MNQPIKPRDVIDHLEELTAIVETLRSAIAALSANSAAQQKVLADYDGMSQSLEALTNGQLHSERYLAYLAQHTQKTRKFLELAPLR